MGVGRKSWLVSSPCRAMAAGCAALVFALGLLAASPHFHEQLHHHSDPSLDDGCAIVLFANGVAVPVSVTALPPTATGWLESPRANSTEILLDSPRYLFQPERGPPVA